MTSTGRNSFFSTELTHRSQSFSKFYYSLQVIEFDCCQMHQYLLLPFRFNLKEVVAQILIIHSRSKCLVWVKMCCHIWLDQNFDPSLLTKKLWPFYMRMKQKNYFFFEKKISKWPTEKKLIFQNRQFSKFFHENFMDWSLGQQD